ncbi:hypothetical protein G4B88_028022 [Cannabis sativa]|uniref:Uncharacterized protein n=1 Tax=Cannabis sativa TaxID=3483 RepID=A0A7J6I877_CANSA|nr:hypothetical protein G4B88_028022 [Cannabis sativa]
MGGSFLRPLYVSAWFCPQPRRHFGGRLRLGYSPRLFRPLQYLQQGKPELGFQIQDLNSLIHKYLSGEISKGKFGSAFVRDGFSNLVLQILMEKHENGI